MDDSLIFCRATNGDCAQIAEVLATYEKESGKKLNKEKTSLFFSKNTSMDIQERLRKLLVHKLSNNMRSTSVYPL